MKNRTYNKKKIFFVFVCALIMLMLLFGRLAWLMTFQGKEYQEKAQRLHERERDIKAARGEIIDRNGKIMATNRTVCTISVIHSQIKESEKVIRILTQKLKIKESDVRKKVEKISSMERIASNVEKKTGDEIRKLHLEGVKVDEDFKRYYPYGELASKVLGFTGGDNQGIIGLEVRYEDYLKGVNGKILTMTDARGIELEEEAEGRKEPVKGNTLRISLDASLQMYTQQMAEKVMEEKQADKVAILMMNPQNGEILAMANVPEFDLNDPFSLPDEKKKSRTPEEKQEALNKMWRNTCINDTYEPGSTFKIITASACLEEGCVKLSDRFQCPGYKIVEDRKIRCHKVGGHGAENFTEGIQNSCNPVFIDIGLRLGVEAFYKYFQKFGLLEHTGVDLPGEAGTILHKKSRVGQVELATMSFGQSFQVTPIQMAATVSSLVNGGKRIVPHFGMEVMDAEKKEKVVLDYGRKKRILSMETSKTMQGLLEGVVKKGSGNKAYVKGYRIGGKTATSQTLPRSAGKYISSFIGFAPAEKPEILGMCVIYNPQGIYYGGTIAAPVIGNIFRETFPYLGIEKE